MHRLANVFKKQTIQPVIINLRSTNLDLNVNSPKSKYIWNWNLCSFLQMDSLLGYLVRRLEWL